MYQIGDKVVVKRNGRFGYITDYTMGDKLYLNMVEIGVVKMR